MEAKAQDVEYQDAYYQVQDEVAEELSFDNPEDSFVD